MLRHHPVTLALSSTANMASGILFQWLLLLLVGPNQHTDALFAALTVPQIFSVIVASSLAQVLAPLLAGEDRAAVNKTVWTLVALLAPLFASVALVLATLAPLWVPAIFAGFDAATEQETVALARICVFTLVFTGLNAVQTAASFARERYIQPDLAQTSANCAALGAIWLAVPAYGIAAAAWISVARLVLQSLLMLPTLGRWTRPDYKDPGIVLAWKRLKPLIIGSSYYKMDPLVDRFLLSSLAPGTLSLFALAQQAHGAAAQIGTKALATPAISRLAKLRKTGEDGEFARDFRRTMMLIHLLGGAVLVLLGLIGEPVLAALFAVGRLDQGDAHLFWEFLIVSGGLLIFGIGGALAAGAFYAMGDTKTPTLLGSLSFTVSIGVKFLFFHVFGVIGLAAAITFQYLLSMSLMVGVLARRGVPLTSAAR